MGKSKRKTTYAIMRQMDHIDRLLSMQPPAISIITGKEIGELSENATEYKTKDNAFHKMMSDENVRYIYHKDSGVIHDKSCPKVRDMAVRNMITSEKYLTNKKPCPICRAKAYIRAGADIKEVDEYLKFFKAVGIDEDMMKRIYVEDKAETTLFGNVMTIKIKEDSWKIKYTELNPYSVALFHNNFTIENKKRTICDGYHMVETAIDISDAIVFIESYDWRNAGKFMTAKRIKDTCNKAMQIIKRKMEMLFAPIKFFINSTDDRAVYYVDGDNDPCRRILGIEKLSEKDIVKIFCAKNNSYFKNPERRYELRQSCKCKIYFIPVNPGSDAVDFAIGMDAYGRYLKSYSTNIYLLSGDKHFDVIREQMEVLTGNEVSVMRIDTIREAKNIDEKKQCMKLWPTWRKVHA